jgi:hypothetical protein
MQVLHGGSLSNSNNPINAKRANSKIAMMEKVAATSQIMRVSP